MGVDKIISKEKRKKRAKKPDNVGQKTGKIGQKRLKPDRTGPDQNGPERTRLKNRTNRKDPEKSDKTRKNRTNRTNRTIRTKPAITGN